MTKQPIFLPAWVHIMSKIDGNNKSDIAKQLNITYSHVMGIASDIEDMGWIKTKKDGRKLIITLTAKGKKIEEHCKELIRAIIK